MHPLGPQHALGRRRRVQQTRQVSPSPRLRQKSPPLRRHRRLALLWPATSTSSCPWAASAEANRPSADATSAAPPSFIALLREMAPLSRPMAMSSKERCTLVSSAIALLSRRAGLVSHAALGNRVSMKRYKDWRNFREFRFETVRKAPEASTA